MWYFWYCYWLTGLGTASQSCSYTPRKKTHISTNFQNIFTSCVLFIAVSSNCFSPLWLFSLSIDWNYHPVSALHNIYLKISVVLPCQIFRRSMYYDTIRSLWIKERSGCPISGNCKNSYLIQNEFRRNTMILTHV